MSYSVVTLMLRGPQGKTKQASHAPIQEWVTSLGLIASSLDPITNENVHTTTRYRAGTPSSRIDHILHSPNVPYITSTVHHDPWWRTISDHRIVSQAFDVQSCPLTTSGTYNPYEFVDLPTQPKTRLSDTWSLSPQ